MVLECGALGKFYLERRTKALAAFSRVQLSKKYTTRDSCLVHTLQEFLEKPGDHHDWRMSHHSGGNTVKVSLSQGMCAKQCYLRDGGSPVDQSFKWLDMREAKRIKKKKKRRVCSSRFLLIKNEFAISALRNLPLAPMLRHVPEQRDSGISAPRAASWLRSAALRAQAAVAPEWCHVVGIYSSKFNFQLSFLPWQNPCLWDFSIQLSLCGSSGMMRGTDPSVILQKKSPPSSKVQRRQHTDTLHYDNLAVCLLFGSSLKKEPTILSRCLFFSLSGLSTTTSALQLRRFTAKLKHVYKDMEVWSRAEEILWVEYL